MEVLRASEGRDEWWRHDAAAIADLVTKTVPLLSYAALATWHWAFPKNCYIGLWPRKIFNLESNALAIFEHTILAIHLT